ncbi:MAG: hypothetical protein JSV90_04460, partial [Methanobacteriota archaeon]
MTELFNASQVPMRYTSLRATVSSGKDDWRTPRAVLDELDQEFGFELDVASSGSAAVGDEWFGPGSALQEDGLEPWTGVPVLRRVAWCNPPYSRAAGRGRGILAWHERAWLQSREGWTTVLLCPPHPGRGWFHKFAVLADEVRVYRRRLAFIDPSTGESV